MKANKFLSLCVITVLAVIVAVLTTQQQAPTTSKDKVVLFPEFKDKINDITEISIQYKQQTLTLVREGGMWKIREADGYPALFSKIKQTAIAVSELEIISEKTREVALYPKLGVEDPDSDDAESKLLTLRNSANQSLVTLIVGKNRLSKSASDSHGLYIRLPGKEQALLVEGQLDLNLDVADWIERDLFDIDPDRINNLNIAHGNDQDITLIRDQNEGDLVLQDIPEGKQASSNYVINQLEGILEDIRIDDVKADTSIKFPDNAVIATINTIDGIIAKITSAIIADKNYATFSFQYSRPEPKEQKTESVADEEQADEGIDETINVEQEAIDLSAKTSGWVYQIPSYKFDNFTRKLDDLIEDVPEEDPEDEDPEE